MNRGLKGQVNPKVTALVILAVLVLVQWLWWRGLVPKPISGMRGGPRGGGGLPTIVNVLGREDVLVETLAGDLEPGHADGPAHAARFDGPTGLAVDAAGDIYVADTRNHCVRRTGPNGETATLAGGSAEPGYRDGPAAQARFSSPCGVAVAPDGTVYVADTGNHRIRRIRNGQVTTLTGGAPGLADGRGETARFRLPSAIAYISGSAPHLLVADTGNRQVRVVHLDGSVTRGRSVPGGPIAVVAASPAPAIAVPEAGALLTGAQTLRNVAIDAGEDAGSVRPGQLALKRPVAVWPAPDGWFAADQEHGAVFHIREGGRAEVLAGICQVGATVYGWKDGTGNRANFGMIGGLAMDRAGRHIYVSDTINNLIRRITLPNAVADGADTREEVHR